MSHTSDHTSDHTGIDKPLLKITPSQNIYKICANGLLAMLDKQYDDRTYNAKLLYADFGKEIDHCDTYNEMIEIVEAYFIIEYET